jgi:hypothetical protein
MINNPNRRLVSSRGVLTAVALPAMLAVSLLAYGWRDAGAVNAPTTSTNKSSR